MTWGTWLLESFLSLLLNFSVFIIVTLKDLIPKVVKIWHAIRAKIAKHCKKKRKEIKPQKSILKVKD